MDGWQTVLRIYIKQRQVLEHTNTLQCFCFVFFGFFLPAVIIIRQKINFFILYFSIFTMRKIP